MQWRVLDDKTKKEYNEKAKEKTAKMETGEILVPKPVTSAYNLFTADAHAKVRAENPGISLGEINRLVNFYLFLYSLL